MAILYVSSVFSGKLALRWNLFYSNVDDQGLQLFSERFPLLSPVNSHVKSQFVKIQNTTKYLSTISAV